MHTGSGIWIYTNLHLHNHRGTRAQTHRQEFGALKIILYIYSVQRSEITLKTTNTLFKFSFVCLNNSYVIKGTHAQTRRFRDHTENLFFYFYFIHSFVHLEVNIMKKKYIYIYILRILILSRIWSLRNKMNNTLMIPLSFLVAFQMQVN